VGISRRTAIKGLLAGSAAAIVPGEASGAVVARPDAVALLYDATLCIGCKTCMVACNEANNLPADTAASPEAIYHKPVDLSARAKTVIKLSTAAGAESFVKVQCMHCVDPACASACMLGALQKGEFGVVGYDPDLCVGCRYCEVACPFNVPKFEWTKVAPKIVKCELCKERLAAHREPACTEVCPRHAVIFGPRKTLLDEAHKRIAENPDRYVPKVYGETEAGGTQALYLSAVPFESLGFPALGPDPVPRLARLIQHGVYRDFIAPVALYGALAAVMWRNRSTEPFKPTERVSRETPRKEDRHAR
jgi:Fe-S-cluster-containing dehydrogenase component